MIQQQQLFREEQQWLHYVGKQYSMDQFIDEALRVGISRRVPANVAANMGWGDRIILARWKDPDANPNGAAIFAEAQITGLVFDEETARAISAEIIDEVRSAAAGGNVRRSIQRICGEYVEVFVVTVSISLGECMQRAAAAAAEGGKKLFVMLRCELLRTFDPIEIEEQFNRGYKRLETNYLPPATATASGVLIGVRGYHTH